MSTVEATLKVNTAAAWSVIVLKVAVALTAVVTATTLSSMAISPAAAACWLRLPYPAPSV